MSGGVDVTELPGWLQGINNLATVLKYVEVTVLTNQECKAVFGNKITDNMICAASSGNDTCQDGGSLVIQENGHYLLIGVGSWGYGCDTILQAARFYNPQAAGTGS